VFKWNGNSYIGASGYYLGNDPRVYQDWAIQNSNCSNSTSNYVPIVTRAGLISSSNPLPNGVKPQNIEVCDGTNQIDWAVINP
jgi:hypothetical protein